MAGDNDLESATTAAKKVGLLSSTGTLLQVDSLSLIDFVVELENSSGVKIDVAELNADSFSSLESVAEMLAQMRRLSV